MPVPYANLRNPQSLNLYSYVQDTPSSAIDRDGHFLAAPQVPEPDVEAREAEEKEEKEQDLRDLIRRSREREEQIRRTQDAIRRMTDAQRAFLSGRYLPRTGGRWGGASTRALHSDIAMTFLNNGYNIRSGGGLESEEFIPGTGPIAGGKGGTYVDITLQKGDSVIRIQTVDTQADGQLTPSEAAAVARIKDAFPNDVLITVPKNSGGRALDATFH
jgi:hypothetical protein